MTSVTSEARAPHVALDYAAPPSLHTSIGLLRGKLHVDVRYSRHDVQRRACRRPCTRLLTRKKRRSRHCRRATPASARRGGRRADRKRSKARHVLGGSRVVGDEHHMAVVAARRHDRSAGGEVIWAPTSSSFTSQDSGTGKPSFSARWIRCSSFRHAVASGAANGAAVRRWDSRLHRARRRPSAGVTGGRNQTPFHASTP